MDQYDGRGEIIAVTERTWLVTYDDEHGEGVMALEFTDSEGQGWTLDFCLIGATCPIS